MGERDSWQYRAIQKTRGNTTIIGAVLVAMLGKSYRIRGGKRFGRSAEILRNGTVVAPYESAGGQIYQRMPICSVTDLVTGFRRLADKLKLDDSERAEMFLKLRQWISKDARVIQNWEGVPTDTPQVH